MNNLKYYLKHFLGVLIVMVALSPIICGSDGAVIPRDLFVESGQIKMELGDEAARVMKVLPLPDGFILLLNESAYGNKHFLLKLSPTGKSIAKYNKRGNGPGELRFIESICVTDSSIFAVEGMSPYVHEFSHNLEFKRDHRVKKGGNIFPVGDSIGIWSLNFQKKEDQDTTFMMALYDRNNFEFRDFAFKISEVPAYVQRWGGICKINATTYAGIYPTEYQIRLLDQRLKFKKNLLNKVPEHIKTYHPWKKSPNHLQDDGLKWMQSWSKMQNLFFVRNVFVLKYLYQKNRYLDIVDMNGNILKAAYKEDKNSTHIFSDGPYLWKLKWNSDRTLYHLVKDRLNLGK